MDRSDKVFSAGIHGFIHCFIKELPFRGLDRSRILIF